MLKIKNLTKTYNNGVKAVDNLNIQIEKGMFGLLGPNGAGKSTLMRTIASLQTPDSGSIVFNDIDVLKDEMSLRKYWVICRKNLEFIRKCLLKNYSIISQF